MTNDAFGGVKTHPQPRNFICSTRFRSPYHIFRFASMKKCLHSIFLHFIMALTVSESLESTYWNLRTQSYLNMAAGIKKFNVVFTLSG
jgi:hypothetical protein